MKINFTKIENGEISQLVPDAELPFPPRIGEYVSMNDHDGIGMAYIVKQVGYNLETGVAEIFVAGKQIEGDLLDSLRTM